MSETTLQKQKSAETSTVYVPDVDINENEDSVRLLANMPGVTRESVNVTVEHNVLTIEGSAELESPEGYELVGQEFGLGRYRRDFTMANTVDTANIKARVQHGILEVTIPKKEEQKTRRIEISS